MFKIFLWSANFYQSFNNRVGSLIFMLEISPTILAENLATGYCQEQ